VTIEDYSLFATIRLYLALFALFVLIAIRSSRVFAIRYSGFPDALPQIEIDNDCRIFAFLMYFENLSRRSQSFALRNFSGICRPSFGNSTARSSIHLKVSHMAKTAPFSFENGLVWTGP